MHKLLHILFWNLLLRRAQWGKYNSNFLNTRRRYRLNAAWMTCVELVNWQPVCPLAGTCYYFHSLPVGFWNLAGPSHQIEIMITARIWNYPGLHRTWVAFSLLIMLLYNMRKIIRSLLITYLLIFFNIQLVLVFRTLDIYFRQLSLQIRISWIVNIDIVYNFRF